jgi:sigma-B regulation protein RsbU (phosphoserine phosphatase)
VADVSGKGADAAMFMARTRSTVRLAHELLERAGAAASPAIVLDAVNRELCQNNRERMFVTLFLGFLDTSTGVMEYVNAGHPLPYRVGSSADVSRIDAKPQRPLGVSASGTYTISSIALEPGHALFVCSDGIADAMNPAGEMYGEARLATALQACAGLPPGQMIQAVKNDVDRFAAGAEAADDITMLAIRWRPQAHVQ